jgi:hypothetical protein
MTTPTISGEPSEIEEKVEECSRTIQCKSKDTPTNHPIAWMQSCIKAIVNAPMSADLVFEA